MRLIDADKLETIVLVVPDGMDEDSFGEGARAVLKRLDKAPTVDAVPIARDLDSKDLIRRKDVLWITKETGALETQSRVRELPAIDAVPVTHCRDCIHSESVASLPEGSLFCNTNDLPFPADGFCSRGLRKEIDNE